METAPNRTFKLKLATRKSILKILKHNNQPRIVSTQMKLTQKADDFTVFKSLPSTSCCSQKFPPKVTVQNCGRALVKPKNQPGWVVLAP